MTASRPRLKACPCCGLVQEIPAIAPGHRAACARCAVTVHSLGSAAARNRLAVGAALAGLILYPLAVRLPVMTLERFGHRSEASVWSGSVGLLREGSFWVGTVVLLASVVAPLAKLVGLLWVAGVAGRARERARTYRAIEWAGRWGMLDVLLLSTIVAWVKLGDWVRIEPGPGVLAFAGCVLASLVAGAAFNPHALWEAEQPRSAPAP